MMEDLCIVIPVYNVREYLQDCLDSIPEEVKVILVNDGSTDGSDTICNKYAESNANVRLVNKVNGGLSDARNAGMPFVDTEYVFFLDSDDRIDGNKLLDALKFASDNNLDWLQCGYAYDYGDELLRKKNIGVSRLLDKDEVFKSLLADGYIKNFAWGKIYRTEIVRKHLFLKGKYYEDSYWQYKVINDSRSFGVYTGLVSFYRSRQESISAKFSIRNLDLLEGNSQRLEFIEAEYPQFASLAALNLWKTAWMFRELAKEVTADIAETYRMAYAEIIEKYKILIKRGIAGEPFPYRVADSMKLADYCRISGIVDMAVRLYERILPSEYIRENA